MQDKNRNIEVGDIIRWLGGADVGSEIQITRPVGGDKYTRGKILVVGPDQNRELFSHIRIWNPYERRHLWEFVDDELTAFVRQVRKEEGIIDG